jgi:hypothetical protein
MPKKTKKEKLRADGRHVHVSSVASTRPSLPVSDVVSPTFTFRLAPTNAPQKTNEDISELHAIRTDLLKTIVLAVLAIATEFAIYWKYFS